MSIFDRFRQGFAADAEPRREERAPQRIALISCAKTQQAYPCKAKELYSPSELFSLSYAYAKRCADRVCILSPKYGLLEEDTVIEPYNEPLNGKSAAEQRAWAAGVLRSLRQTCDPAHDEFIILAGRLYYENLLPSLTHVELPLAGMRMGDRKSFLKRQLESEDLRAQTAARRAAAPRTIPAPARSTARSSEVKEGDKVCHDAFGDGRVIKATAFGSDTMLEVEFDGCGRKHLMLSVAARHMKKTE